jgi:hypothetical protein
MMPRRGGGTKVEVEGLGLGEGISGKGVQAAMAGRGQKG